MAYPDEFPHLSFLVPYEWGPPAPTAAEASLLATNTIPAAPRTLRRRVNVSRTSKGHSIEVAVEGTGYTLDELMAEFEATYTVVDQRFPRGEG